MALRAFVAVHVEPSAELDALLSGLAATGADLRLAQPDKLHVTLSFLGDVPDEAPARLAPALDAAAAAVPPFRMRLRGVGAFPDARRPRVVWIGLSEADALASLARRVRAAVAEAGCPGDDKPFYAHVTLARTGSARGLDRLVAFLRARRDAAAGARDVAEVRLYRSTLLPGGARHDVLHAAPLGGAA